MRYFDQMEIVQEPAPNIIAPANLHWMDNTDGTDPNAPYRVISVLRATYPPEYTLQSRSLIDWQGKRWKVTQGEMLHTRRGKPHHKSATLERVTG